MNIQAMMREAQKMQNDMLKAKKEIDEKTYIGESSFVKVYVNGTKKVKKIEISNNELDKDDMDMLSDMLVVALNAAFEQIDKETEEKMGKYTKNIPGLF